ncbi:hypothetical protein K461DRAFT_280999 [Myriangium duriaei CBS 260.36]|uniref:non-specific serine/threonine protein kinase n=1 Tax=Myriangium duriaei CBS 260.36 TaxID=1168546 RepID=A0A9P4IXZ4_9PEZI|nr:hypothetical protein K461DRAFT_280999 [Myriangium duriaei CBS 260.36]
MPPGSGPRLQHALLYLFVLSFVVAAQQQQPNLRQRPPPQDVVVNPSARQQQQQRSNDHLEETQKKGKDTAAFIASNERALATFAPDDEFVPSVRARPARSTGAPSGLSRQSARSLQDWQVEDILLLATVDGKIYARERYTGAPRWELEVDRPMVQTTYHKNNKSTEKILNEDDLLWLVEPSRDGALYVYSPDSRMGMQRLGLTVKQLVEELSPWSGEDPPVVYTAEKKNTLYTIDASNGNILKMFSSAGSVTNNDRSCRKVNALESLEDQECEPLGTLTLGRTEYTVGIQDSVSGDPIATISFFEWGPNNRDRDLQDQYSTTLDNRYIYSKHDGSIMALEHSRPDRRGGRRSTGSQSLMYSHKFSSPVVRVFDVVRLQPEDAEASNANLVVLPQPVGPVNEEWPVSDNIFVNVTEGGSWYALSEKSYPLVTDGASRALCYTDDIYMPQVKVGGSVFDNQKAKLVGVHPLSALEQRSKDFPAIGGGPDPRIPVVPPPESTLGDNRVPIDYKENANTWTTTLPSPITLLLMALVGLSAFPPARTYMHKLQKALLKSKAVHEPSLITVPSEVDVKETVEEAVQDSDVASGSDTERKVRFPEPAEETIFPQDSPEKDDEQADGSDTPTREPSPESSPDVPATPAAQPDKAAEVEASPAKKEKKARRGVRGGRKLKEKKLEQEQAQQRRRAHSQSKRNSISQELTKIPEDGPQTPKPIPQIISVDASESPDVSGKIQINNLLINTDRLIGRGSAGTCVFEGNFGKRDVAVKRMLSQYYELASQEVVFLQENDDHPNVIRYYCQEKDQNFLYIAVELCQASLWDLFFPAAHEPEKREEFGEVLSAIQQDVPRALFQIVLGLRHLHSRRIIHRDIKPQNILIARPTATSKGPRLLISDFGLCKTLPENVSTLIDPTGNAGTCGWKAPELISQPKDTASLNGHSTSSADGGAMGSLGGVKRAADIFSLGCLFFWVLTGGCHPFDDKEGWAQIREFNIKKNNMQNMHKLDLGSDTEEPMQLITAMLAHRPEDRPNVNDILEHPFFWSPKDRLQFLCDVSDHFEREPRDPPSWQLDVLESYASTVIEKGDFLRVLPRDFVDTLGKQRKYTGNKMLDLLRALRNKRNHYEDMPDEVKRRVGPLPGGYLNFWTARFPKLLMGCYWIVRECSLADTERFQGYFEIKE